MRKLRLLIPIVFIILCLSACHRKPAHMSDTVYNLGKNAYDIMSDYLDGTLISSDECISQLEDIYDRLDDFDLSVEDENWRELNDPYAGLMQIYINSFITDIKLGTNADLEEDKKKFANSLWN